MCIFDFFVQVLKRLLYSVKTKHYSQRQVCAYMNGEFRLLKIVFSTKFYTFIHILGIKSEMSVPH